MNKNKLSFSHIGIFETLFVPAKKQRISQAGKIVWASLPFYPICMPNEELGYAYAYLLNSLRHLPPDEIDRHYAFEFIRRSPAYIKLYKEWDKLMPILPYTDNPKVATKLKKLKAKLKRFGLNWIIPPDMPYTGVGDFKEFFLPSELKRWKKLLQRKHYEKYSTYLKVWDLWRTPIKQPSRKVMNKMMRDYMKKKYDKERKGEIPRRMGKTPRQIANEEISNYCNHLIEIKTKTTRCYNEIAKIVFPEMHPQKAWFRVRDTLKQVEKLIYKK